MKTKIFKLLFIVIALLGFQQVKAQQIPGIDNDSVAIAIGSGFGGYYNSALNQMPDSLRNDLSKNEILKGVEYLFTLDSFKESYMAGITIGRNMVSYIKAFNNSGLNINNQIVVEEFYNSLILDIPREEISKYNNYIINFNYDSINSLNTDSLALCIGAVNGGILAGEINSLPDSIKYLYTKSSIFKSVEHILNSDINNQSYLDGLSLGCSLYENIIYFENKGLSINKKLVLYSFKTNFLKDSINQNEIEEFAYIISNTKDKIRNYELENSPEAIANKKAGKEFIANLKKSDKKIKTTSSGLSYKIIEKGNGNKVADQEFVKVAYKGSLIDGTVFDDSNGEFREFPLDGVIPGFSEGLKLLNEGGKAILYIPGDLGYGLQGTPAAGIGSNATLIFEVEIFKPSTELIIEDDKIIIEEDMP